tara:strand:+ start:6360 stop:7502 length:1143 start_codon:yes stop_codon:yes gene_type:complete
MKQSVMKIGKSMFSKTGNLISGVKKSIQKSKTIKKGTSKIKSVFEKKRLERQKRNQKEQNLENKDNPTIPQKNRKIEPKKFGSNILSAIKKLLLGWLVINIPKIIESIKVIIDKIKEFVDFIKNIIPNIKKFIGNLFQPFKKLDDDIVNLDLKSGEKQVKQEIDNFETETKNTIGEFDPEEKKQLDEEDKKDTEEVQLTTKKETISTKKEVSGRLDMDTGKTYINEKEVSADEYNTFANMSMTEKVQNYGQTESFESTDSNLLNEEGGLNISLENFKDNTPDASSLQQADSREGNLSVNNISKTLEIDKSVVNNKNMTTVNNINQFRKQKRKTVVINSNNQNNNNMSNNMMQTKSSSNVVVVKEKSKKIDDLLFSKLGDL